jgi:hypothetical protein
MRKTFILTLVLSVFAVVAYAQTGASTGTASTTTSTTTSSGTGTTGTTTTTTKTHHKKAAAHKSVKGTVASVDASAKSFAVHPSKGEDVTLKVNDKTKYTPKGKGWDDIAVGCKVTCTYKNDGTDNWAISCRISCPKAAAPAKSGK